MTDSDLRADPRYTFYQAEFFRRFETGVNPGNIVLLVGPPGSGKSFTGSGVVSELMRSQRIKRALILTPAALTAQWGNVLGRRGQHPLIVDARAIRILRNEIVHSSRGFPEGVYVMSIDFGRRPDVQEVIVGEPWDLVLVDEAHRLAGQRLDLVEKLAGSEHSPMLLLMAPRFAGGAKAFARRSTVVDWGKSVAELRSRSGIGSSRSKARTTRAYRSSGDEVQLADEAIQCARQLGESRGMTLLRRESSSISSLEDSLVRWVEEPADGLEHLDALSALLQRVEGLSSDSRVDCYRDLVAELLEDGTKRVVTFCEYRTTLDYLAVASGRPQSDVFVLHGGMDERRRAESISRFEAEGGLLIATSAVLRGWELSCDVVVHYDVPVSRASLDAREAHLRRAGRELDCYLLEDESRARPLDTILFEMARREDSSERDQEDDASKIFRMALRAHDDKIS